MLGITSFLQCVKSFYSADGEIISPCWPAYERKLNNLSFKANFGLWIDEWCSMLVGVFLPLTFGGRLVGIGQVFAAIFSTRWGLVGRVRFWEILGVDDRSLIEDCPSIYTISQSKESNVMDCFELLSG